MSVDKDRLGLELRRAAGPSLVLLALIVAALVSLGVILSNIGFKMPWTDTYTARVAVDDVTGVVTEKQTVRLAGIEVGRIKDIELDKGGNRSVLTISMDPDQAPLYRDARLRLRPETPLQDQFINIEDRGTKAAGELGDEVLPAERTRSAVGIGKVLDVFNANTRTRVEVAVNALGEGLGPRGPEFRQTLNDLAPFLAAAQELTVQTAVRKRATARLVHNFRLVTEELARREGDVRQLVRGGSSTLTKLAEREADVRQTIAELPPTMRQLESTFATVRSTADELDPALDGLRPVTRVLPEGLRALERFGGDAEPALAALSKPLPRLRRLVSELRPTARGLRGAFDSLLPLPADLDRITGLIGPCEKPLSKFFHNTMSVGKYADDNSVIIRGQTVVGANSAAGLLNDGNQTAAPSCAPGKAG